jgi:hypothetical protein
VDGEGEEWRRLAHEVCDWLVADQVSEGDLTGAWLHREPFMHTYRLEPPWLSAMAQGQGASLLAQVAAAGGDERYAEAARRAVGPLQVDVERGGVLTTLRGHDFYEEYPTRPGSYVLNGVIFTLWGLLDLWRRLGDDAARPPYQAGLDMLEDCLHLWDAGYWSRYDLFPHPVVNLASSFYHSLHVNQLTALQHLSPRPGMDAALARFAEYRQHPANTRRVLARKVLFRLAVPRNRYLRWWLTGLTRQASA